MSQYSEACDQISKARNSLSDSIKGLSAILVDECSGSDEIKGQTRDDLSRVFRELLSVRERLAQVHRQVG